MYTSARLKLMLSLPLRTVFPSDADVVYLIHTMVWHSIVVLIGIFIVGKAQEYYVTPTPPPNAACPPDKPCHTLSYYASNAEHLFNTKENVSLFFLDGNHTLVDRLSLEIEQTHFLTVATINSSFNVPSPQASLLSVSIIMENISNLIVSNNYKVP